MGWSSGSRIMNEIIEVLKDVVDDRDERFDVYYRLIEIFENNDCDTLDECLNEDTAFDEAYRDIYPEYFEEEE